MLISNGMTERQHNQMTQF